MITSEIKVRTERLVRAGERFDEYQHLPGRFTSDPRTNANRAAAADWIDRNQLGRRNLTPDQMSLLRGRRYNRAKQAHGGQKRGSCHNENSLRTAALLAREHGVAPSTINRDGDFATAVEQLKPVVPDIERKVIAGELTRKAVRA